MLGEAKRIYLATRKRHDQVFNTYFMRPIAGLAVAILARTPATPNQVTLLSLVFFVAATACLVLLPDFSGGLVAVLVLELSYLFDCCDGMLARHKKLASKEGHLFDFFTDELKAVLLTSCIGVRLHLTGGFGIDLAAWPAGSPRFLFAAVAGTVVIASAISLTNFIRRPELTGKETPVEAHYETVEQARSTSLVGRVAKAAMGFLQLLGHYPSHVWIFAMLGRLDVFFWMYVIINLLYLGRGWLGLLLRFGR
jgi:phosphatidylglycerophosphate synthase